MRKVDPDQQVDAGLRKRDGVVRDHSGDARAGSDERDPGARFEERVRHDPRDVTEEEERDESSASQVVFHVVTEHGEEVHVRERVDPSAVEDEARQETEPSAAQRLGGEESAIVDRRLQLAGQREDCKEKYREHGDAPRDDGLRREAAR